MLRVRLDCKNWIATSVFSKVNLFCDYCSVFPVSLDCSFLIVRLVFSNVYLLNIYSNLFANHNILLSDFRFFRTPLHNRQFQFK
jgi:hypothetical protein